MLSEIWNVVSYRMRALFDRDALDRELDEELRFHLEREAERHEHAGLSREDALRRAEAEFGRLDSIKEASRRARGTVALDSRFQDLRGNPRTVGVACAIAATGLGLAYMTAAGAPALYLAINVLALLMGLALYGLLRPHAGEAPLLPGGVTLAFGAVLLATTLFGVSVEGASRWIRIAGVSVQISLVLLPTMLVAFARQQQALVDGWLPTAKSLAAELPGLRYYEMPTIGRGFVLIRPIISNGMRNGVTAQADREATITLYTNVDAFRRALALPSEDTIYALLLDRAGIVRWRGEGTFTDAQGASLRAAAERLLRTAAPGAGR